MKIKVPDVGRFKAKIQKNTETIMKAELPKLQNEVESRTLAGKDVNNAGFQKYSNRYAAYKAKRGLSSNPNLKLTGQMLSTLRNEVGTDNTSVKGRISIGNGFAAQKAEWNQGGNARIPIRRFMGLSKEQVTRLVQSIKKGILK